MSKSLKLIDSLQDFTLNAYSELLVFIKERYAVVPLCEANSFDEHFLILRHDIDASLEKAFRIAKMEHTLGLRSSFFVLFSSNLYNLLEKENIGYLRQISRMGHEIGLHYDLEQYNYHRPPLEDTLRREIKLLENLVGKKVCSICCHNPSLYSEDPFIEFEDLLNPYSPKFFKDILYISDSCRAWNINSNSLRTFVENYPPKVQLLIHPFLWTDEVMDRYSVLDLLFSEIVNKNLEYKESWKEIWRQIPHVKEYDRWRKIKK